MVSSDFVGAYLVGSFAVGGADLHSDADFLVVTQQRLSGGQQADIQALHGRLYEIANPWAQHLEGSYVSRAALRRVDPTRAPLFFLDHGASELIWDPHCNTALSRWTLREHGRVLAGPEPGKLVDWVNPDELRSEARSRINETATWARAMARERRAGDPAAFSQWAQPSIVLSLCRMLHTIKSGQVVPKRVAAEWAISVLDSKWQDLIRRALRDRPDPWGRANQPAADTAIEATLSFTDLAVRLGTRRPFEPDSSG